MEERGPARTGLAILGCVKRICDQRAGCLFRSTRCTAGVLCGGVNKSACMGAVAAELPSV